MSVSRVRGGRESAPADLISGTGREIAGIFEELPDRKMFPDYYQAIKRPISLEEIEVSGIGALTTMQSLMLCS